MRTQIVFPLQYGTRVFGVMTLETRRILEYSKPAGEELERLANAIAIIHWLHNIRVGQSRGSHQILDEMRNAFEDRRATSPLSKRKVFLASSSQSPSDVVGIIRDTLNEFSNDMEVVYWKEINASGNINEQILRAIGECSFGICYFSEPASPRDPQSEIPSYRDNPNVIFEAGMLHSLTSVGLGASLGWIPIREQDSPRMPFDFASERTIIVPRLGDTHLNKEDLKDTLRRRIRSFLET